MFDKYRLLAIMGFALFVLAMASYIIVVLNTNYTVLDDSVSWFHKHVVDYISANGDLSNDRNLRFIDGRDLYRSPILVDLFVYSTGIPLYAFTILNGLIYIVFVFIASYLAFRDYIISGLSTVLFVLTPSFTYWFKPINYGSYLLQSLWLLPVILITISLRRRINLLGIISSLIVLALWFVWSDAWILYVIYGVFLATLIYSGGINRDILVNGSIMLLSIPLNLLFGLLYVTIYHVLAYCIVAIYILIGFIEYMIITETSRIIRNAWRLIGAFSGFIIGLGFTITLLPLTSNLGIPEAYSKTVDPISDYGILSILSLFGIILLLRSGRHVRIIKDPLNLFIVLTVISSIVSSYLIPTLTVYFASAASIITAFALKHAFTTLYYNSMGKARILYTIIGLWIIIGSIAANAAPAIYYSSMEPSIAYGDLPRELLEKNINATVFLQALDYIRNESNGKPVIVISYWGFSYWIVGYLGDKTYTIADPDGSRYGWRYISKIYLSTDEYQALGLINNLRRVIPEAEVYLIVSSVISVEEAEATGASSSAHLGYPIVLPQAGQGETEIVYRAVGDPARLPLYIYTLGEDVNKYINFQKAKYVVQTPLSWSDEGANTMIVKLVTNAVKALNYSVVNDVYSPIPLTVQELKFFKPVKVFEAPFKIVDTGTMKLRVEYMVAVYKVES